MHYTERFVKTENNKNFYYKVIDWINKGGAGMALRIFRDCGKVTD